MRYKRMVNNRMRGFTLTEMLVALAIAGLLFVIAVPSISILKSQLEKRKYEAYKDSIKSATKLYVNTYKEDLNFNGGAYANVTLDDLISKDLIDEFEENTTCNASTKVIRSGNKFRYCTELECNINGNDKIYQDSDKYCTVVSESPSVEIKVIGVETSANTQTFTSNTGLLTSSFKFYNNMKWTSNNIEITVTPVNNSLDTVELVRGNSVLNSGYFTLNDINEVVPVTFDFSSTIDLSNAYIVVTNSYNNKIEIKLNFGIDKNPPSCGQFYKNFTSWSSKKNWSDAKFTVDCDDFESGCKQATYSKSLTSSSDLDGFYITIEDNMGNKTNCSLEEDATDAFKKDVSNIFISYLDLLEDVVHNVCHWLWFC